ncbi:MAG: serine hydrolase, partial [Leptolyngbyaceae bacterium]|nr:serine hydrolase [Leptolyngbyaceae bacterium]
LRDRLTQSRVAALQGVMKHALATFDKRFVTFQNRQHILQTVHARIHIEETAEAHWNQAIRLSEQAIQVRLRRPRRVVQLEHSQQLWQAAITQLQRVPSDSSLNLAATRKMADFQQQLVEDVDRYDRVRSHFLVSIAARTGLDLEQVHITVCTVDLLDCHRFNGDRPPVSAASLIKLPIAVALMQKLTDDDIDPDTLLYIHPDNATEDPSELFAGRSFPLEEVMGRMIDQSSNIATNQLIDYLGFDYINAVLEEQEFEGIVVRSKLMGDRIRPQRMGRGRNQITTDAMTQMMGEIYQRSVPGHELLISALLTQTDTRMAQAALDGDEFTWLGEKTGWNSLVLGSTTAALIGDELYVMTVATDRNTNTQIVQEIIRAIATHILENDGF